MQNFTGESCSESPLLLGLERTSDEIGSVERGAHELVILRAGAQRTLAPVGEVVSLLELTSAHCG